MYSFRLLTGIDSSVHLARAAAGGSRRYASKLSSKKRMKSAAVAKANYAMQSSEDDIGMSPPDMVTDVNWMQKMQTNLQARAAKPLSANSEFVDTGSHLVTKAFHSDELNTMRSTGVENDMRKRKTWFLVDGLSLLYRFYFASIRQQTSSSQRFNFQELIQGTMQMYVWRLARLIEDYAGYENPIVVVLDARHLAEEPGERLRILPQYKANRAKMPEDMKRLIPVVKSMTKALGMNVAQIYGQEADDVIGSLTKIIGERGDFSCIVSNDKDFQQLLEGENIKLLKPCWNKSSGRWTLFTENDFRKEYYGLDPERYSDVLAIAGDKADNIPGVPGIGEKHAAGLLAKVKNGSLPELLKSRVEGKKSVLRARLELHKRRALELLKVTTISEDLPIDGSVWLGLRIRRKPIIDVADRLLRSYGLRSGFISRSPNLERLLVGRPRTSVPIAFSRNGLIVGQPRRAVPQTSISLQDILDGKGFHGSEIDENEQSRQQVFRRQDRYSEEDMDDSEDDPRVSLLSGEEPQYHHAYSEWDP